VLRVSGEGCRVQGIAFRVYPKVRPAMETEMDPVLGKFRCSDEITTPESNLVQASGFRVQSSGFRDQGSGIRVQGSGFMIGRVSEAAPIPYGRRALNLNQI